MKNLRLGILFGGLSSEHEVSLASSRNVLEASRAIGGARDYDILEIGLQKDGKWVIGEGAHLYLVSLADASLLPTGMDVWLIQQAAAKSGRSYNSFAEASAALQELLAPNLSISQTRLPLPSSEAHDLSKLDVAFPVLHGPYGEDGVIQGFFQLLGVPVVGCGVLASAVAMDKIMTNYVMDAAGVLRSAWFALTRSQWKLRGVPFVEQMLVEQGLQYPIFVKPANAGSSVGISKVKELGGLSAAIDLAFLHDRRVVIEQGVVGREIELAVIGTDEVKVSSVASEIIPKREFYDYEAKYIEDSTEIRLPADLPKSVLTRLQDLSRKAFESIDGAGMARVDFFYDEANDKIYLNEINTIPGFTNISQYPALMKASGRSYREIIDELISVAVASR